MKKINNIAYTTSVVVRNNNRKTKQNLSFQGMTKTFEKDIYMHPHLLKAYYGVESNKNKIAGRLPKEFIDKLKSQNLSQEEKRSAIKEIYKSFEDCISILREIEKTFPDNLELVINKLNNTQADSEDDINKFYGFSILDKKELEEYLSIASRSIEEAFKKQNLIDKNGKVEMSYLGCGCYGYAFNISFKNEKGEKIFHDKTLKMYKNDECQKEISKKIAAKIKEKNQTRNIEAELKETEQKTRADKSLSENEITKLLERKRSFLTKEINLSLEEIEEEIYSILSSKPTNAHGIAAEANRALFLKNKIGNIKNSNYVEAHFFDFKNNVALFETADETLPKVKKPINLEKFYLVSFDDDNPDNEVCGRLVDYGGLYKTKAIVFRSL